MAMFVRRLLGLCTILAVLGSTAAPSTRAQIVVDRPGFADRAVTINEGVLQAEMGYTYRENGPGRHRFGPVLLRAGLRDGVELRGRIGTYVVSENRTGYDDAALGAKIGLLESRAAALSVQATTTLPIATVPRAPNRVRQEVKVAFDAALTEALSLSVNSGARFFYSGGSENDRVPEGLFLTAVGGRLTPDLSAYVGYAGFYGTVANRSWVESGLTVLTTPNTQVDVSGGLRVDGNAEGVVFFGVGMAHRL